MVVRPEKRLLISSICSLIGDSVTDVAIATILYRLTKSPTAVSSVFIFRFFAIFVSGILVPGINAQFTNKKSLLIAIDLVRALSILLLIFAKGPAYFYFVTFFNSLLNGLYQPVKQLGVQQFVPSSKRVSFISLLQTANSTIFLAVPALCGLALNYIQPNFFFILDALSFLLSAALLLNLPRLGESVDRAEANLVQNQFYLFFQRVMNGYKIIFHNEGQTHLLIFRLFLLFVLSTYDVVRVSVLTTFANQVSAYHLPSFVSFSFSLGAISTVASISSILTSLYCGKRFNLSNIKSAFYIGTFLLMLGLMCWAIPNSLNWCWLSYIAGSAIIAAGLSFARVGVHTVGLEITNKDVFVEVTSTADAISRLWQSAVSSLMVGLITFIPLPVIVILSGFVGGGATRSVKKILNEISTK